MNNYTEYLMPAVIAVIMYGIGMGLRFRDFSRVFLKPKAILTGLACQLLLLPLIAFALIYFWPIAPIYKAGFILIAAAPGGTASNLVTHMLKGRVALSVSLTSFNSFAILFTIPLFVSWALHIFLGQDAEITISRRDTFQEILYTVVIPVIAGVVTNEYSSEKLTQKLERPLRIILPGLLLGVFLIALFADGESNQPAAFLNNLNLFVPLLFLNIITMAAGFFAARWAGIKHDGNFTIAVEMGLQNSALAIFIATSVLGSPQMALVAVIYTSFTFFSTWFFGWLLKHYLHPDAQRKPLNNRRPERRPRH